MTNYKKNTYIIFTIGLIITNILGLIFTLVFDNNDIITIFNIVYLLLLLLLLNIRSSGKLKNEYKEKHGVKRKNPSLDKKYKEIQKIILIFFIIQLVLCLLMLFVIFN